MSVPPPIQYTTYTPAAAPVPPATQTQQALYPNHYPNVPVQPTSTYYSPYPNATTPGIPFAGGDLLPKQSNPAPARPPSPPEPGISPSAAARAIHRLIENEFIDVGFQSAESQTVNVLGLEVAAFIQQLFERAHEYANLANRAGVLPSDLLLTLNDFGIEPKELYPLARKRSTTQPPALTSVTPTEPNPSSQRKRLKRKLKITPAQFTFSSSRSPSPGLLASDDESGPPVIPATLRGLPPYFPQLPPKHTYLQTPASPPKKAALPSLEKKLKTASLVQDSLKNLLLATEDSTGQEDAELLGHIVNWETGLHPRKRWKVGGR